MVHGYDAVNRVLRDSSTFRMQDAEYMDRRRSPWRKHPGLRTLVESIFFANGADHTRVRRLFSQVFTSRRVAEMEPAINRLTERRLNTLAAKGADGAAVDFMAEFALPLPSDVMAELLGVPEEDRAWFPPRARAIGEILELDGGTPQHVREADLAAVQLTEYIGDLVAKRRAHPTDDLVSALARRQAGGAELSDNELIVNLITLFNAGYVTTTHLLGNGLVLLFERPELLDRLRKEPELVPGYVEEILRFEPPTHFGVRWAAEEVEIAGVTIPAGGRVLVLLGAANRDPERFPSPDTFDPFRVDNHPLSFGGGAHYCLGAALSRLEGKLALPAVLQRFPDLALAAELGERSHLMLRGFVSLPVTV